MVEARVVDLPSMVHRVVDFGLVPGERLQLPVPVVDNPNRRSKAQLYRPVANHQRVVGILESPADD